MKVKILIVAGSLRVGGIERSLVNLLNCIDFSRYQVDLFLYSNSGEYLNNVPEEVKLVNDSWLLDCIGRTHNEILKTKNFFKICFRSVAAILCKIIGSKMFYSILFAYIKKIKGYDVAISYSHNGNPKTLYWGYNQFVLKKVSVKKKIAWIHSDYIRAGLNISQNNNEYRQFDAIVNVSYAGKSTFDQVLPELQGKSYVVYNMYPINHIRELAVDSSPYDDFNSGYRIVSVGRIDTNKAFDRVIRIASRLREDGFKFRWFIVGDGPDRKYLEELCNEIGLQSYVYFVGNKQNPYPYIKNADLFVLTSKYEGMPMVVSEALILGIPVITTRYASAEEQIKQGVNGYITDNCEEDLYQNLILVLDGDKLTNLKNNLISINYSNDLALSQFQSVIEK